MQTPMMIGPQGNSCPICSVCVICAFWNPLAVLAATTGILGMLP